MPAPAIKALLAAPGEKIARAAFTIAQQRAQRQAYKQRAAVLRSDEWLDESLLFAGD